VAALNIAGSSSETGTYKPSRGLCRLSHVNHSHILVLVLIRSLKIIQLSLLLLRSSRCNYRPLRSFEW
jgi:hypothetical protein